MSLDGTWESLPISGMTFQYPPPSTGWISEKVPSEVATTMYTPGGPYAPPVRDVLTKDGTDFKRHDRIAAWFRRTVNVPAELPQGKRIVLHFDGMAFRSKVWLNGKMLGESVIGQLPQDFDVTSIVKPGHENALVVALAGRESLIDIAAKSYIAPGNGVMGGIWGHVSLQFIPRESIDDLFVHTSVRTKRIDIETTVANNSSQQRTFELSGFVTDQVGRGQCNLETKTVTVASGDKATVVLGQSWIAPKLWAPESPALYVAHISLKTSGATVDSVDQRFGFREFWIDGRDFYLNGERVMLKRNSFLTAIGAPSENADRELQFTAGQPYNAIRLHIGFDNVGVLDACDRMGVMTTPELAMVGGDSVWSFNEPSVWLPNFLNYEKRFIKIDRSRPSIVIWNLVNETFWGNTDDMRMKIADQFLATARAADPTRPQEGDGEVDWGGRLPIINVHYPESTAGALRMQYPDSSEIVPNDLYWLTQGKDNMESSWRSVFKWDRPLIVGEYFDASGNPDTWSSFMGESVYDWEKWRLQNFAGRDNQPGDDFANILGMLTDAYRIQGVAGVNPWAGYANSVMPAVAVRPLDFHTNFYGGATGVRKVAVFDDSDRSFASANLQCRLTVDGTTVSEKIIPVSMSPGQVDKVDVPVVCPEVAKQTKALLTIRLRHEVGGTWAQVNRLDETIYIMPPARWTDPNPAGVALFDPTGATSAALAKLGMTVPGKSALSADDLAGQRLLIVSPGANAAPYAQQIGAFAAAGGRVLLLSSANAAALSADLPEVDTKHIATRTWLRSHGSLITGGLEEPQLSYWLPDNIVSTETAYKPSGGKSKIFIDAGGLYGLKWTPLCEVSHGSGAYILSTLNLVDRIGVEPAADTLLLSLIRYGLAPSTSANQPIRLLAGDNSALKQALEACSIVTSPGLSGTGPILFDTSFTPTAGDISTIQAYLHSGGSVWLHGFTPATLPAAAPLFPFAPKLEPIDPTVQTAARRSDDPWMDSISTFDFAWSRIELGARNDYFGMGQPTASIGKYELVPPPIGAATKLVEPGLLWKIPTGSGAILFDTLPWENALGAESDKVTRLVSALTLNLGGDIKTEAAVSYSYFNVNISKQANRGYYDEVAGDGKGGWTDQGANDNRYFLINHSGKLGNMDVGTGDFPSVASFAGRPFALVDPKKNDGRAVIVLRGQGHDPAAPESVNGIVIGHKADKLWFLQCAVWAVEGIVHQELGRYIVHYTDGTTATLPQREGLELTDWWSPGPLPNSKVGWTGKNDLHAPVGVYVTEWTNPNPDKEIATIDVIGNLTQAQIVLLGITGGTAGATVAEAQPIADWDFSKATGAIVPNAVSGGPALAAGANAAAPVAGTGALIFAHGSAVAGDMGKLPGVGDGTPWTLEASFDINDKPDGYCGGIFESMQYGHSGARLVIGQDLKLSVDMFGSDGKPHFLTSSAPLSLHRDYVARVVFGTSRAYLYLNGHLDSATDCPPPAPFSGRVQAGRASGKDYNFNGSISRIELFAGSE